MGQRRAETLRFFFTLTLLAVTTLGCDRSAVTGPTPQSATQRTGEKTVASLVPAATDMIVAMGLRRRLVAVSNWDAERPKIANLPRVGDYRTVDWEKLAALRPDVMIVQWAPDKMPPGVSERAAELNIQLINLRIVHLDEIFTALEKLGDTLGERKKADATARDLHRRLDGVRAAVAGRPPVRTLISRSESPLAVVGGGNFMNDLLTIAGGRNVIEGGDNSYPNIDVERLIALNPEVIIHLLPGESPQVIERAKSFWWSHPELTAVKSGRVYYETESYMLLPGPLVGKVAQRLATLLHPGVTFPDEVATTMPAGEKGYAW